MIELGSNDAVAILSHDPKFDEPAIVEAIHRGARYVGAVGSRKTQAEPREAREAGLTDEEIASVRGPIGLDLGGKARGDGARDHGRDRRQQVRRLRPADARAPGDDHRDAHGDDRDGWLTPATTGPRERLAFVRSSSPPARQPGSVARSSRRASTASRSFATSSIRSRSPGSRPVVVIGPEPPVGVDLEGAETVRNWHPERGLASSLHVGGRSRPIGRWSRARPTRSSCSSATSPWSGRRCSGGSPPSPWTAIARSSRRGMGARTRTTRSGSSWPPPARRSGRRDRGLGPIIAAHPELVRWLDVDGENPDVDTAADLAYVADLPIGSAAIGSRSIDSARSPTAGTSTRRSARSSARTRTGQAIRCWRRPAHARP